MKKRMQGFLSAGAAVLLSALIGITGSSLLTGCSGAAASAYRTQSKSETEQKENQSLSSSSDSALSGSGDSADSASGSRSASSGSVTSGTASPADEAGSLVTLGDVPEYSGEPYIAINHNVPYFEEEDLTETSYEHYSDLDSLGRCGVCTACIGKDLMPTGERQSIGSVKPTGWHTVKYEGIDGNYLYNRCHLIGYQLTAENANEKNLITGTRYMNTEGMLPFENMTADYIKETGNHVMYRVTPVFDGENLLASGVLMEAESVEDQGDGIEFCVYCYNVQPGITINYATGDSSGEAYTGSKTADAGTGVSASGSSGSRSAASSNAESGSNRTADTGSGAKSGSTSADESSGAGSSAEKREYIVNTNTGKFHLPSCSSVKRMNDSNRMTVTESRQALISEGYEPCKNCNP